jgi:hypothetical protein
MFHCLLYKLLRILYTRRYGRYLVEWGRNIYFFIAIYILNNGKKKRPDSQTILIYMLVMRLVVTTQPHTQWTLGGSFPRSKADKSCSYHSPPFSTEVKNAWSYTSTLLCVSMMWCLIKHRDNFTISLKFFYSAVFYLQEDRRAGTCTRIEVLEPSAQTSILLASVNGSLPKFQTSSHELTFPYFLTNDILNFVYRAHLSGYYISIHISAIYINF